MSYKSSKNSFSSEHIGPTTEATKNATIKQAFNTNKLNPMDSNLEQADIEALKLLEERLHAKELHDKSKKQHQQQQQVRENHRVELKKAKQIANKLEGDSLNLSFCGCGFLGVYHVGVTSCFQEYAPQLSQHKISGSSAGALVAVAHICGTTSLAYCTTDILTVAIEARSHTLGPFHPSFDIQASVREALERGLPEDAYLRADGKLHVSLTRVEDGENVIINEFKSNEELIQVLLCSCFIPFWSGFKLPKHRGVAYIDGGFSNNLVELDAKTITVSPFSGEADICPKDDTLDLLTFDFSNTSISLSTNNLYRISHALLPPAPEVLSELFEQGFADGIRFLQRMNLISCTKCLEIRSSLVEDVVSISSANGTTNEFCNPLRSGGCSETSSMHQIVLEQQEQKIIEINSSNFKRNSQTPSKFNNNKQSYDNQPMMLDLQNEDDCGECVLIRQKALYGSLPAQFKDRVRETCESVNKSLYNWIYSHRPIKYFSYLFVPYYLPIDVTLAVIYRCWKRLPLIRSEVLDVICQVVKFILSVVKPMHARSISSILMESGANWEDSDSIAIEKELLKRQKDLPQVLHHHHHHHHVHHPHGHHVQIQNGKQTNTQAIACSSSKRRKSVSSNSSNTTNTTSTTHQPRELHSLEDTFDSIVDVTSKQEARIFAYHFRDEKNRLTVTEIFDLQRAAGLSNSSSSLNSTNTNEGAHSMQSRSSFTNQ